MKSCKNSGRLVAELRKIIGKSQVQFATMIGASKHTIISVENARSGLSPNLASIIQEATGADLSQKTLQSPFKVANYTRDDFDRLRNKYYPSNEETARNRIEDMKPWLNVVFLAAAKAGAAGNRDRLPAVCLSFRHWLKETRRKFKLDQEMEDLTEDETRHLNRIAFPIISLIENPANAQKDLREHGIDFARIKKQLEQHSVRGWLIVEDEFRQVWTSSGFPFAVVCSVRKLLPRAKCWIKTLAPLPPGRPDADQLDGLVASQRAQMQTMLDEPESQNLLTAPSKPSRRIA